MKKRLKTAICTLLVIVLAFSAFGCKKEEAKQTTAKTPKTEQPKEEPKKPETVKMEGTSSPAVELTVSDFMDAYIASDIEKASKTYVDDKEALVLLTPYNLNDFMLKQTEAYAMDPALVILAPHVVELSNLWYTEALSQTKYEITDVAEKGKSYIATVELKGPDFNSIISDAEVKIADMLTKKYNLTETMTDAEIRAALGIDPTATPEQASLTLDDAVKEIVEDCKKNITEDVSHIKEAAYELKFFVSQKKTKWLINPKKSDISALDKIHKQEIVPQTGTQTSLLQ